MENSNFERYAWTTIWVITGIILGIIFVIFYGVIEKFNVFLLLLWSIACTAVGGLMGFIFSVPRIIANNSSSATYDSKLKMSSEKNSVQENTNLTEISDWLTKILIGAGLVELKEIPKFILHVAKVMALGIRNTYNSYNMFLYNSIDSATIVSVAIILYFVTWGFISGYLIMKLVLTEQFAI